MAGHALNPSAGAIFLIILIMKFAAIGSEVSLRAINKSFLGDSDAGAGDQALVEALAAYLKRSQRLRLRNS